VRGSWLYMPQEAQFAGPKRIDDRTDLLVCGYPMRPLKSCFNSDVSEVEVQRLKSKSKTASFKALVAKVKVVAVAWVTRSALHCCFS
jgi:hypothetical protein